eukprot:9400051-Alexandrium_andersonii.AAC.1
MDVRSCYVLAAVTADSALNPNELETHDMFAISDLLAIDSQTAEACHALIRKQLASVGCPAWTREGNITDDVAGVRVMRVFIGVTDSGSDEVAAKNMISSEVLADPHTLFFSMVCWMHQIHLVVKKSLVAMDRLLEQTNRPMRKYFGTVAKIMNVWRSMAKSIFECWVAKHGFASA